MHEGSSITGLVARSPGWFGLARSALTADQFKALLDHPGVYPATASKRLQRPDDATELLVHWTHEPVLDAVGISRRFIDAITPHPVPLPPGKPWNGYSPHRYWLRPYQLVGAAFARSRRGAIIADSPGTGKTRQAIASWTPDDGLMVIFGPLAAIADVDAPWRREFRDYYGWEPYQVRSQTVEPLPPGTRAVFCGFEIAHFWAPSLKPRFAVIDEADILAAHPRSRRSAAIIACAARADRVLALTGTPMWSRPMTLYGLLHLVAPWAFGGWREFGIRYASGTPTAYGFAYPGLSNHEELLARLDEIMLRRTEHDIGHELPPVHREVVSLPVTATLARTINEHVGEAFRGRDPKVNVAGAVQALACVRRAVAYAKVDAVVERAVKHVGIGESVVVWAWHRHVVEVIVTALVMRGIRAGRILGGMSTTQRAKRLAEFRAGELDVLVCNLQVGGVALDLTVSHVALFAELDWQPRTLAQAAARTRRERQTSPCQETYFILDSPVEHGLIDILDVKEGFAGMLAMNTAEAAVRVLAQALHRDEDTADFGRLIKMARETE